MSLAAIFQSRKDSIIGRVRRQDLPTESDMIKAHERVASVWTGFSA